MQVYYILGNKIWHNKCIKTNCFTGYDSVPCFMPVCTIPKIPDVLIKCKYISQESWSSHFSVCLYCQRVVYNTVLKVFQTNAMYYCLNFEMLWFSDLALLRFFWSYCSAQWPDPSFTSHCFFKNTYLWFLVILSYFFLLLLWIYSIYIFLTGFSSSYMPVFSKTFVGVTNLQVTSGNASLYPPF